MLNKSWEKAFSAELTEALFQTQITSLWEALLETV